MNGRIRYVDLAAQYAEERQALASRIEACLSEGQWVGGALVAELERSLAARCGAGFAVTLGSGTDAIIFALQALGIGEGDEVITAPNSFVATAAAIVAVGARPVFADVGADRNLDPVAVEAKITARTRAILPVHLGGRMADMRAFDVFSNRYGLRVVEDAAQAFGSTLYGRHAGTMGTVGCFSAHPLKTLNACGDAGFVVTNDEELATTIRQLGNNGLRDRDTLARWGRVSRLDVVQAAILQFRLERVDAMLGARRRNAAYYDAHLDRRWVTWPAFERNEQERFDTFHTFIVEVDQRDALRGWLLEHGIETNVHYPVPIHLQPPAAQLGYRRGDFPVAEAQAHRILSLPVHPYLTRDDLARVVETIHGFYAR